MSQNNDIRNDLAALIAQIEQAQAMINEARTNPLIHSSVLDLAQSKLDGQRKLVADAKFVLTCLDD